MPTAAVAQVHAGSDCECGQEPADTWADVLAGDLTKVRPIFRRMQEIKKFSNRGETDAATYGLIDQAGGKTFLNNDAVVVDGMRCT